MTRAKAVRILRQHNPTARTDTLVIYTDAVFDYIEATANIAKHGSIVAHPRTGQPIDNPYIKVKDAALKTLKSVSIKNVDALWRTLAENTPPVDAEDTP